MSNGFVNASVPNIAHYILNNEPFNSNINLKGFAIGNACWGGNETKVNCNGPNHAQMMSDILMPLGPMDTYL